MQETLEKTPIKRNEYLKPLSRDHHHGLLFCWKIRTGLQKKVATERIAAYARHFFQHELLPHFTAEEKLIFPLLGEDHPLIKRALFEHKQLKNLFNELNMTTRSFDEIIAQLNYHIRFEERILFQEIQQILQRIGREDTSLQHTHPEPVDYPDSFWERSPLD
jgi:iron-sulfur cluster repair protein YtfE (RIC family)